MLTTVQGLEESTRNGILAEQRQIHERALAYWLRHRSFVMPSALALHSQHGVTDRLRRPEPARRLSNDIPMEAPWPWDGACDDILGNIPRDPRLVPEYIDRHTRLHRSQALRLATPMERFVSATPTDEALSFIARQSLQGVGIEFGSLESLGLRTDAARSALTDAQTKHSRQWSDQEDEILSERSADTVQSVAPNMTTSAGGWESTQDSDQLTSQALRAMGRRDGYRNELVSVS